MHVLVHLLLIIKPDKTRHMLYNCPNICSKTWHKHTGLPPLNGGPAALWPKFWCMFPPKQISLHKNSKFSAWLGVLQLPQLPLASYACNLIEHTVFTLFQTLVLSIMFAKTNITSHTQLKKKIKEKEDHLKCNNFKNLYHDLEDQLQVKHTLLNSNWYDLICLDAIN